MIHGLDNIMMTASKKQLADLSKYPSPHILKTAYKPHPQSPYSSPIISQRRYQDTIMHLNNHRICQAIYTINHITNQNHHPTSPTHASTSGSTVVGRASTDLHLPNAVTFTRRGKSFRKCQEAARSGEHCCSHVSIECCKLPPSYNPTSNIHSGVNALAARAG